MAGYPGPNLVEDGLVLCLDAGNQKSYPGGGSTWFDISGNRNHATLVNTPTFTRRMGGAFQFNGTSQYATMPSTASLTISQPTIMVACSKTTGTVLAKGQYGNYWNYGILGVSDSGGFKTRHNNGDVSSGNVFLDIVGIDCPYIHTAVYNGTATEFYRSGELGATVSTNYSPSATNSGNLTIGSATSSGGSQTEYYSGSIFAICIYNRRLTSTEVFQNYRAWAPRIRIDCQPEGFLDL